MDASNVISIYSATVATGALGVAIMAQWANHKLAARIANAPGRLHSALIEKTLGPGGQPTIELICVNGPSEVTLRGISLGITYYKSGSFWRPGPSYQFWIEDADELRVFGVTGPDLPIRLGPNSDVKWKLPRRGKLPRGDRVVYKFEAHAGHRDKSLEAKSIEIGGVQEPLHLLRWMRIHQYCGSGLSSCLPSMPETVKEWIYQRPLGSGDTSPASKPNIDPS